MHATEAVSTSAELMSEFLERTGVASGESARRYLWTDAFAVCNGLGLARTTGERKHAELALRLVEQVHRVLGRRRDDDAIRGWLSGLPEAEGAAHPTRGGLRIGKPLPERRPGEGFDEELEWERDGQYFHYLTKWMHALDQVAAGLGLPQHNVWARELAVTAHAAFVRRDAGGGMRMAWKMSTDLTRPLVDSMGQHDPLDGYLTCVQLESTAERLGCTIGPRLSAPLRDFAALDASVDLRTADPLGLGGLLGDAWRVAQLEAPGWIEPERLLVRILRASQEGLAAYARQGDWRRPAERRLGFRELGLAIGLSALELLAERLRDGRLQAGDEVRARVQALGAALPLRGVILATWLDPDSRHAASWTGHRDINDVMLATALAPEGFLVRAARGAGPGPRPPAS